MFGVAPFSQLSLSMGEASAGAGGLGHRGLLGPRGLSLLPLAILCLVFGAGGHEQPPGEVQEEMKILELISWCHENILLPEKDLLLWLLIKSGILTSIFGLL